MPSSVIIGIGSDIGREMATRLLSSGWSVTGTYRDKSAPDGMPSGANLVNCDLTSSESIRAAIGRLSSSAAGWDFLLVCAGSMEPIGTFWDLDSEEWERAIQINALSPLRMVRALYPFRSRTGSPAVAFFSGAGTNNAAPSYSAYCASKILLIKMCELLDAESEDTSFFILGPGIVRTKIHQQTLDAGKRGGENLSKVVRFLASEDPGVSHDEIYACLQWCIKAGKGAIGGRNISLVHDAWRDGGEQLLRWLAEDSNRYKLRRFGNDYRNT